MWQTKHHFNYRGGSSGLVLIGDADLDPSGETQQLLYVGVATGVLSSGYPVNGTVGFVRVPGCPWGPMGAGQC